MNKTILLSVASIVTLMSLQSCTGGKKLPKDPKEGQEYVDDRQNRWVWNPAGFWYVYSNNGLGASRYYPSTNLWRNGAGQVISTPSNISATTTNSLNESFTKSSYKANSSSSKATATRSTTSGGKSVPRSGGFGSSGKTSIS